MNNIFKKWIRDEAFSRTDEFSSKMIMQKIIDDRGCSPYICDAAAIGWYLGKLDGIVKVKDGIYTVVKE